MDGGRQAAKLEIHVKVLARGVLWVAATAVLGSAAQGQRYRVLVGIAGTTKMSLIEFSPCIPAETSACGAWIDRVIDTASDSSFGPLPVVATEESTRNHTMSISVQDGHLNVHTGAKNGAAGRKGGDVIADARRIATAVVVTGDSRYAFAVLEAKTPGKQGMVRMIDFGTKMVIASIGLADRPAGISMAP
jgi:hypothetical protein